MLYNTSIIENELKDFPSHFEIEERTKTKDTQCTLTAPTIKRIQDRIKDGESEHFSDSQVNLREHFKCRDLNLTLFLEYKMSMLIAPGTRQQMNVVKKMIKATVVYPDNMIAWSNLAHLTLEQKQVDEVEKCLEKMKELSLRPWEQVLADAEMAYAYRRIGPRGHEYCKMLCRKVVDLDGYPSLTDLEAAPIWLDELKVEYSYEAALVIQRLLNPAGHSDSLDGEGDHPEKLMKESAQMLKTVVFSTLSGPNVYEMIGWLTLSETFRLYKKVYPNKKRTLKIVDFGWPGLDSAEQCLEKAVELVETSGLSNVSFRALHMLGSQFKDKHRPYYDLDKAKKYIEQAAKLSNKPAIQHHLALIYRQKWINERGYYSEKGSTTNANIRDPGHPLLKKAISHLEKADEYSHGTSVLFQVELARLKYSYSEDPISEESRNDIMDILNGCIHYTTIGLTTSSTQSYLFHELALMHQALLNDMVKCRQYLELSVEKAHKAKNYSHALLQLKEMVKAESLTESERYRKLGEMYTVLQRYDSARWNLEKARQSHPRDPDILENLVVSLIGLEEFQGARQCLILLRDIDNSHLETKLNRDRYIDVSMKVAQQFSVGIAASIYQKLIMDLRPKIAADTIIVISSEEPSDTVRTKKLVYMIRHGLGFTEDNCILPIEVAELHGNVYFLEYFVKKAWCVVIHLTNIVIGEGLESLLRDIDNSIEDIWERKGRVVVVDDVTTPGSTDWKQSTGKMRRCQPWISYSELFHPNLEEEVNAAELLPRDEQALDSVEDCATALQSRLHMTDPSKSTAPEGRGETLTEMRESTATETVPATEQREGTAGDEGEVSVTEQGNNTAAVRREVSGITHSSRIAAEEGEVSTNEQGASTAANEMPPSEQTNRTAAAEGTGEGMSVPEAIGAPRGEDATELESWTPSALERLIRAMLSDRQVKE